MGLAIGLPGQLEEGTDHLRGTRQVVPGGDEHGEHLPDRAGTQIVGDRELSIVLVIRGKPDELDELIDDEQSEAQALEGVNTLCRVTPQETHPQRAPVPEHALALDAQARERREHRSMPLLAIAGS
jgi:hypothetical protein